MFIKGSSAFLFGCLALFLAACAGQPAEADVTVLRNFTLIDGTGQGAKPDSAMIIDDGRIAWVGPVSELDAPANASTVDLTGRYVMPGLIDLHVHLANVVDLTQDTANFTRENLERDLGVYASYGITTVLSMGTDRDLIFDLRREQREGRATTTRVYTAGQGIVLKNGYGGVPNLNNQVSTPAEAAHEVDVQAAKGVDFIKVWVDDELGTMPRMSPEISQAVIDAAHRHGLRAVAHIFYLEDARRLVDQGIDGLVHSVRDQPIDQALIDDMKSRGVWQIAETLSREASMFAYGERAPFLDDPFFTRSVSPAALALLASPERQAGIAAGAHFHDYPEFFETAKSNLALLAKGGVNYGFGTDSGPPGRFPGYFSHWELELMVEAGFTPEQAITTATSRAAEFLGADDIGVLEASRWADLIVLDANPLEDIRNTRTIRTVYIAGRPAPVANP
jgi:imidazolonepropionase-like amidohydrolase